MSITSALSNALSGLSASSRAADVTSSNVSNALTEGYGVRRVEYGARMVGRTSAGVTIASVSRHFDLGLTSERRSSEASVSNDTLKADFHSVLSRELGSVTDDASLAGRITSFEAALITASSKPESNARLLDAVQSAESLATTINGISDQLSQERMRAEEAIARNVDLLQTSLTQVRELNIQIQTNDLAGHDFHALMDQRQVVVDQIAELIPVREIPRQNNMIALYSESGSILLDFKPATVEFSPVHMITPDMTLAGGALSGLEVNGQPVATSEDGPIAGGTLSALFALRDTIIPTQQSRLDALARDLIERFEDPASDATITAGQAGLFTDGGSPLDPLDTIGLAGRLAVNDTLKPETGGGVWRLRDGLYATAPGALGSSDILQTRLNALTATRNANTADLTPVNRSVFQFAVEIHSVSETERLHVERSLAASSAHHMALRQEELANGVDTDQEMQQLMIIEQSYAANAKVIQTIQTLVDQLMRLT